MNQWMDKWLADSQLRSGIIFKTKLKPNRMCLQHTVAIYLVSPICTTKDETKHPYSISDPLIEI